MKEVVKLNKYDFDFIRIEDVLYNLLGITETNNINALKMQIRENLLALQEALMKKNNGVSDSNVRAVEKQLAMIDAENDIDKVLSECIKVRLYAVLSLDAKIRLNDSYGAKSEKKAIRNELYAISDLVKSVPSFNKFLKNREILLNYIDSKNRIVSYNKRIDTSNINSEIPQIICHALAFRIDMGCTCTQQSVHSYKNLLFHACCSRKYQPRIRMNPNRHSAYPCC